MLIAPAPWRPDKADLNGSSTMDILNVFLADGSVIPVNGPADISTALAAACLGAFTAIASDGSVHTFVGAAAALYKYDSATLGWETVTRTVGGAYNATSEFRWWFAQFGDFVVCGNQNDDVQVYELNSSTDFAALAGSPPRAGMGRVWGDFLCLMNLTANLNRVHWSGLNDITEWTPGTANCDFQDFPDGGNVQSSSEATNPIILQERAIRLGTFVPGSVEIFTFVKLLDKRGAKSVHGVATRGVHTFFVDEGGFFLVTADGAVTGIGFEKVDRTIFGLMSSSDIANIQCAVDPFYSRAYFAIDLNGVGYYDRLITYDWGIGEWTQIACQLSAIFPSATPGFTLEGLDALYPSIEDVPFSLDSKVWQGGAPTLACITTARKYAFFSGQALEATITTQELGDTAGQLMRVNSIYPVVDTSSVFVSLGSRFRRSDNFVWTAEQAPSSNTGIVRKKARAKFHKAKVRIPAGTDWNHFQGVDADTSPAGFR